LLLLINAYVGSKILEIVYVQRSTLSELFYVNKIMGFGGPTENCVMELLSLLMVVLSRENLKLIATSLSE
jgi:hypothetical protein